MEVNMISFLCKVKKSFHNMDRPYRSLHSRRALKQPWILKTNKHCHNSDRLPFLRRGGGISKFWLPSPEGGTWKIKKGGWMYVAGAGLLNREGWHFSYLIFSRFIIFKFHKIVLCIIFFYHHNFMKKGYSNLSKNEPENKLR